MAKNSQTNGTQTIEQKKERKPRRPNPTPHKLVIRKIPNVFGNTLYVAKSEKDVITAFLYNYTTMELQEVNTDSPIFIGIRSLIFSAAYSDSDIFTLAVSEKSVLDLLTDRQFIFGLIQKDTNKEGVTE